MSEDEQPLPEIITDWGETVPARPGGCPQCGYTGLPFYYGHCYQCGADFPPVADPRAVPPSHDPGGTGAD
nr:hypothetical protein [Kibdelosporangium sp. MJ126-NF4]CEL16285.1 hypothetical protein [Kibdelosporangium sp. MJ126-NF4]